MVFAMALKYRFSYCMPRVLALNICATRFRMVKHIQHGKMVFVFNHARRLCGDRLRKRILCYDCRFITRVALLLCLKT